MPRQPLGVRLSLALIDLCAALVPRGSRDDWRAEWHAEVRHRWQDDGAPHTWSAHMDLFRRAAGAFPDAAWLRRQFTVDADAVHDLRHGVRMLWQSPGFALSAVLILALGLGSTIAIVALLDTLLFRPLPYAAADRVVTLWTRNAAQPGVREDVAPADFLDWRERAASFEAIAAVVPYSYDHVSNGEPRVLFGAQVTDGFWQALGVTPMIGRPFEPREYARGGPRAAIITYGLWQSLFGGDPAILSRTVDLDGNAWSIVGVLPPTFAPQLLPRPGELSVWAPKIVQDHEKRTRGSAWWNVVARLKPGVSPEEAQREMESLSAALAAEHPRTNSGRTAWVMPLREHLMGEVRTPLFVMFAAVVLVLGIGCANVASLLLARGMERHREFAIRRALGAGWLRIARQLAVESLLLAGLAAIIGVGLAHWTIQGIIAVAPSETLRLRDAAIDGRVLAFAAALAGGTAVLFGLLPAFHVGRGRGDLLREREGGGPAGRLRRVLVAAEIAFALVLLVGAGLLIRSFGRLMSVDPGFSARNVVALQVFAWDRTGTPERLRAFFDATMERMHGIPGVDSVGAVSAMPFAVSNIDIRSPLEIVGRPTRPDAEQRGTYLTIATPDYFRTMSIPLREGRLIAPRDSAQSAPVGVISDSLARREWPDESPVGRRVRVMWHGQRLEVEIVGVVSQIRHEKLDRAARPELFLPMAQVPFGSMTYVLRGEGEPRVLIEAAKREVWAVDPLQTVYDAAAVASLVDASVVRERFAMTLMSAFAIVALILCASGIYGIISYTTAQRTREIGVRMALGADAPTIRRMVLREGSIVILVGVVVGLAASALGVQYLRSLLFETRPGDPLTIATVCAVLIGVGLAACVVPARRATRVDPLVALRHD